MKKLFTDCEEMFTITCKCDDRKPKMTAQAVIKHMERNHQKKDKNGKNTFYNMDKLRIALLSKR